MRTLALVFGLVVLASAGNLLGNADFEEWLDDSTPRGWTVENRSRTAVFRERDTVRSGSASARLVRRYLGTGNNYGVAQRVPVEPSAWYHYSVWCRDDSPDVSLGVGISWRKADSSFISSTAVRYSADSSAWQRVRDSACAPAEAAWADFRIRTYVPASIPAPRRAFADEAWFGSSGPPAETVEVWFAQDSLGRRLCDFIGRAQVSLDYCHYNSTRADVVQALLGAGARGVRVRVITDSTRLRNDWVRQLRSAGIPVWSDSIIGASHKLMHNKFAVRDMADADSTNDRVWVASYNPNQGELRADCAIELPHSGLSRAYLAEFEQMWGGSGPVPVPESARFQGRKRDRLATHEFRLNGYPVFVYFSPQDRPVDTIARLADMARRHVLFGIFAFTHDGLGDAMIRRWQDSVWVGGTIDKSGLFAQGAEYPRLVGYGLPVYEDSVPFGDKIIHEKVMVIDSTVTVAGSVNWSAAGNAENDENAIIFHDPAIAGRFLVELSRRFWEATNPGVAERPAATRLPARRASPVSEIRPEPGTEMYDACGRRIRTGSRPGAGVYFLVGPCRKARPVVIVR